LAYLQVSVVLAVLGAGGLWTGALLASDPVLFLFGAVGGGGMGLMALWYWLSIQWVDSHGDWS